MPAAMAAARRTVQISDEDFGGRSSKTGSALVSARAGGVTISTAAKLMETARTVKGSTPAK
jgi:hypothetical protein